MNDEPTRVAVAFLVSEKCDVFCELADGSYHYLRKNWESSSEPLLEYGPDPCWVLRGIESGDVIRNGALSDTALFLLNRQLS